MADGPKHSTLRPSRRGKANDREDGGNKEAKAKKQRQRGRNKEARQRNANRTEKLPLAPPATPNPHPQRCLAAQLAATQHTHTLIPVYLRLLIRPVALPASAKGR